MSDLDRGDGVALHLVETHRHGVQRRGQLRHGHAHGVDVLAQPVGVQPERGAAAVEPQRVEGVALVTRHLRARAPALPPRVAAERPWAAALRAGDGEFGPAAAVAAAGGGVDHGWERIGSSC